MTGRLGQDERAEYLRALAAALTAGECTHDEAVAELHALSEAWIRNVVRARVRRLPPHADPQTTEHWLWVEWHAALRQFDPARVESFPGYVALRLRMAVAAAAREDDPLPRAARAKLRAFEQVENGLVQHLGRPLTRAEEAELAESMLGEWRTSIDLHPTRCKPATEELVATDADPAATVEQMWLRSAVRGALMNGSHRRPAAALAWLEEADEHDRPPSVRVANVPKAVRDLLVDWAENRGTGGTSAA